MAQQIINYDEEMVGANHPTKSDTLNRGFLVSHAQNGGVRNGDAFPASDLEDRMFYYRTDLDRLYVYDLDDTSWRSAGATMQWLTSATAVISNGTATTWTTVDCSSIVLAGTKAVFLEAELILPAGTTQLPLLYLRQDETTAAEQRIRAPFQESSPLLNTHHQVTVALDADRCFQYKIDQNGQTGQVTLMIVGYM